MSDNINKYRAFLEAVRRGSFTKAASALSCSQSGVSHMISDLERLWDVSLFERGGGSVVLTRRGEELLPLVEGLCRSYDRLHLKLGESCESLPSVRIATTSSIAAYRLPRPLGSFVAENPQLRVDLRLGTYAEVERLVLEDEVDLGFLPNVAGREDLLARPFDRDEIVAVLPVRHRLASRARVGIEELADEEFVADAETVPPLQADLRHLRVRFETADVTVILSMVESGLGVSLLPSLALERCPFDVLVRHLANPAYRTTYVACRRDAAPSPCASALFALLDSSAC